MAEPRLVDGWVIIFWPGSNGYDIEQHSFDPFTGPELPYKPEHPSLQFVAQVNGQNVRAEHRTSSLSLAQLVRGQFVSVVDIYRPSANEEWGQVRLYDGRIGWAAIQITGVLYLKRM